MAALARHKVDYILISGQACVYYGAKPFSVDVDIWIALTPANLERLRRALADLSARPLFLPPLEAEYLSRGHAAHFRHGAGSEEIRVDIMGRPPRVDHYQDAREDSVEATIEGVRCRVIDKGRLVRLKKTNRPKDYLDIAALVEDVFEAADQDPTLRGDLAPWLAGESRTAVHLLKMAVEWLEGRSALAESGREVCRIVLEQMHHCGTPREADAVEAIEEALAREFEQLRRANLDYWRPLLAELRRMHRGEARDNEASAE